MNKLVNVVKIIVVLWIVHLISAIFTDIRQYGIIPRETVGIAGIFTAPFLHGDIYHLMANTTSFFIFGCILALIEPALFFSILINIMIIGGFATWIFAREANHIGASGVIFGVFGYIVAAGFFRKKFVFVLVSILVIFIYGSMIFQVLPGEPGVSWESHLFGFLAGIFTAHRFSKKAPQKIIIITKPKKAKPKLKPKPKPLLAKKKSKSTPKKTKTGQNPFRKNLKIRKKY
ncbi:rhomboid family intramembrane serine protease [Candidatus Uabimicrobium sp. HlEnr_7]|uniref:rhomboid family intramembrane serine protease n=1 Tax=Candidatus Uabimicrobium helgolandensis TaxID=3095367 RepID=UPI0035574FB3